MQHTAQYLGTHQMTAITFYYKNTLCSHYQSLFPVSEGFMMNNLEGDLRAHHEAVLA